MYRRHSRNSKKTKIREFEKAQEQIKETIEALYKHHSETRTRLIKR
jgi:hypothetical protein